MNTTTAASAPIETATPDQPGNPAKGSIRPLVMILALSMLGFMAFNTLIGPISRDLGWAEWQVGAIVTVSGLMWLVGAKPWGRRIDAYGARHVAVLALTGFTLLFVVLVLVVYGSLVHWWGAAFSFLVILPVRCILSLFYGAIPIASQAYVGQVTRIEDRGRGMAALSMGSALGMILGPASAALLSGFHLVLPVVFGCLTGGVALWLARRHLRAFPVVPAGTSTTPLSLLDPRVRLATISALIALFAVMSAQVNTGFLVQDTFKLDTRHAAAVAGAMLSAVGVALVVSGMLVRRYNWAPLALLKVGSLIAGLAFMSQPFMGNPWLMAGGFFMAGIGMGLVFPAFQTLASVGVETREQGNAAAAVSTAQALGMVVAPIVSTSLYHVGPAWPYVFIGLLMLAQAAVLQWRLFSTASRG